MDQPILTIVIATKNRERYCIEAIRSILRVHSNRIQITISDNSETDKIKQYLFRHPDERILYRYDKSSISSIDNFNRAMELATGEYVCMIGDDDTILPCMIDLVYWMKRKNIDSVSSARIVDYIWPNSSIEALETGELVIPYFGGEIECLDTKEGVDKLFSDGIVNYQSYKLPRIYHGIIKMSCMEEIKTKTGHYFGGLSPDIYSTVALSVTVKSHYVVGIPFSIAGACPASTSVANMTGQHSGVLREAPHFRFRGDYIWEDLIPEFYSVETIWAESGLKAAKETDHDGLFSSFKENGIYRLFVYGLFNNRKYIKSLAYREILKKRKVLNLSSFVFKFNLFAKFIQISFGALVRKVYERAFNERKRPDVKFKNIPGLKDAIDKVNAAIDIDHLCKKITKL